MKERILIVGSVIFQTVMMVISGVLITRTYSKTLLGTYQQAVLIYSTFAVFVSLGTPKAILYFITPEANGKKILWHILSCIFFILIVANVFLFLSWNWVCTKFSNPDLQSLYFLVFLNLLFRSLNELFNVIAISAEQKKYIWRIEIGNGILIVVLSLWICYYKMPISLVLIANLLLDIIKSIALFDLVLRHHKGSWTEFDKELLYSILKYSLPLLLSSLMLMFSRKIDSFLISTFMTPDIFAVYSRGALEIPFSKILIVNISMLVMPVLVQLYQKNEKEKIIEVYHKEVQRSACLVVPLFFSFVLVHKDLIIFLYTEKYLESIPIFLVYLFFMPMELYAFDTILQSINQSIKVFYVSCISVACHFIISLVLIQFLGIIGPAIGGLCTFFIANFFYLYFVNKTLGFSIKRWLPWKFLVKTYLVCFPCFAIFFAFLDFVTIHRFFKIGFFFGISYLVQIFLLWKTNMVIEEDKNRILNVLQKIPFLKKFCEA